MRAVRVRRTDQDAALLVLVLVLMLVLLVLVLVLVLALDAPQPLLSTHALQPVWPHVTHMCLRCAEGNEGSALANPQRAPRAHANIDIYCCRNA